MVVIDMKMPACCDKCPCSYWVMSGPNEGRLMCNVMEANKKEKCLVEQFNKPAECPILMEIRQKDFERWLETTEEMRIDGWR